MKSADELRYSLMLVCHLIFSCCNRDIFVTTVSSAPFSAALATLTSS